jgi:hypothetical protein
MATVQQVEQRNISPEQRARFFAQMTRQHQQMRPAIAGAENATVSFNLDKVRLSSKILLQIDGILNVQHAANNNFTAADFAPFSFIRNISVEINNGFKPFAISGREAYWYNLVQPYSMVVRPTINTAAQLPARGRNILSNDADTAGNGGADNPFRMIVELPLTLNERDPIGMILTQNEETVVSVAINFGQASDLLAPAQAGYTMAVSNLTVTPMVESFSIPPVKEAFPDISILKLVQSTREAINGAGPVTLRLPVGLTYRKLLVYIEDANGGVADAAINSPYHLVLNGADYPYQISPTMLAALNEQQYFTPLPQGLYCFDFSYQGIANYSGARDYVDTERLTEFWFNFQAPGAGTVTAVYELLSRLRA